VFAEELGIASAAKMCRSVIIKGLEALITESLLPSRRYGVESVVIESLQNLMPGVDWAEHARYMISRSLVHGSRRAEEMRQVTAMLEELGFEALMSEACVSRQAKAAQFSAAANEQDLAAMLDRILEIRGDSTDKKDRANADH
jgi:3-hydroxyisobutyrate dehydrogenase-like beta-hydroxyacid dehydrogenase